jgi:hypothetical protein
MLKGNSAITRLTLTAIMSGILFPATLSAVTINGTVATLAATDRTVDNTELIQGLLNQSNPTLTKIIIPPGTGNASWPVRPLFFGHGTMEVHLNANTVLEAKTGGYPNSGDCVLTATSLSNIKVTGDAGSKILMHKEEYANYELYPVPPATTQPGHIYAGEWRTALKFLSCSNVTVSGLTLANTGGDGIYLGDASANNGYCSNVTISNVVTDGVARNAVSVISADGLSITDCTFKNTCGLGNCSTAGPWAGIDLEPNKPLQRLKNINIERCKFLNNKSYGVSISTVNFKTSTDILGITLKNCSMRGNLIGTRVQRVPASLNDASSIKFQDCVFADNKGSGVEVLSKSKGAGILYFNNCYLSNNNLLTASTAFWISIADDPNFTETAGDIQLNNVVIETHSPIVTNYLRIQAGAGAIDGVSGKVYYSSGTFSKTGNYSNITVTSALNSAQSWWKMDETSDSIANDSAGTLDGTLYNSPAWTIGRIGGGLTLNGTNQYFSVPDDYSLDIGTGDFSIALWMQRSSDPITNKRLICKGGSSSTDKGYTLSGSDSSVALYLANGAVQKSLGNSFSGLNKWQHVVFTVDRASGKATAYMNGSYKAEVDISTLTGDINSAKDLFIGANSAANPLAWPGKVDDVRIYKRVLTPGEIGDFSSSASACWKLDGDATDSIGRSSGALTGSPSFTTGILDDALMLTGSNQFVDVSANASDLDIGTGDYSIALWMQRSSDPLTTKRLIGKGAGSDTDKGFALSGSNTSLGFVLCNGTARITTAFTIPSLDVWHHVVFTVDRANGKVKTYLNGSYQTESDISAFAAGVDFISVRDFLIGANNTSNPLAWPGKVDDVRIYKRVLTADEVYQLRSATSLFQY